MNSRTRRALVVVTAVAIALLLGRWTVATLAERWWAAAISPAAAEFVTRWQLLGFALDAAAIVVASGWFAAQALLVARAIASVQVEREVGDLRVRERVPPRVLVIAAVATGVLLGVLTGAGARAWRVPIALAWQGVRYGVNDPVIGSDVGVHVAQLPVWNLAHDFAFTLAGVGLALTAVLYLAVGGIRREPSGLVVHPDARRHLGWLLAFLALAIGAGYLIAPYHLAASGSASLGSVAILIRTTAMQAMAGACIGVAVMSVAWAIRPRHTLVAAGWMVLGFGAIVERVVVPALAAESDIPPDRIAAVRRLEALAWGMRIDSTTHRARDTIPAVTGAWDESLLARATERLGAVMLVATPQRADRGEGAAWLVATAPSPTMPMRIRLIAEPGASELQADAPADIADARIRPDAPPWRPARAVAAGDLGSRLVLAWARQAPGMLGGTATDGVDWHLDPAERAAALVPMASWTAVELARLERGLTWIVQGFVTTDHFPSERRMTWGGRKVAGATPAFIALIDATDGGTRVYADPAADSLGRAWARFIGPMVEPAAAIPADARDAMLYSRAWFETQLGVLEDPVWGNGSRPGRQSPDDPPEPPVTVWDDGVAVRQAIFEDPARRTITALVSARRVGGVPRLNVARPEAAAATANARELERLWLRFLPLQQRRDSARASGDTVISGSVRWHLGPAGLVAWQPLVALPARDAPALLWFSTAMAGQVGGGRTASEAWAVAAPRPDRAPPSRESDAGRLEAARRQVLRADSALARGDMVEFGRAFEALRNLLGRARP